MEPLLKYIIYFLLGIICYYLLFKGDLIEGMKCDFDGEADSGIIISQDDCTCGYNPEDINSSDYIKRIAARKRRYPHYVPQSCNNDDYNALIVKAEAACCPGSVSCDLLSPFNSNTNLLPDSCNGVCSKLLLQIEEECHEFFGDYLTPLVDKCLAEISEIPGSTKCYFGDTCEKDVCIPLQQCNLEGEINAKNCKCTENDISLKKKDEGKICGASDICERTEVVAADDTVSNTYECRELNECTKDNIANDKCKCFPDTDDKTQWAICKAGEICNGSGCKGNYCPITREGEGEDAHAIHTDILERPCYCHTDDLNTELCGAEGKNQICNKLRECKELLSCEKNTLNINEPCKCNATICKINEICTDDSTAPGGTLCKEIPSCVLSTDDLEIPLVNKCFCEDKVSGSGILCSPSEDQSEKIYCNESKGCYKKQAQIYEDCVVNETESVKNDCIYTKDDIQSVCQKGKMYNASGCWSRKPILRIPQESAPAPAPVYDQPGPLDDLFDQIINFFENLFK